VTEVLELPQLAQRNSVTEVQVRRGGVDSELGNERAALRQLGAHRIFRHDVRHATLDHMQLLVYGKHGLTRSFVSVVANAMRRGLRFGDSYLSARRLRVIL
jgi:hypothetical protein